MAAFVQADKIDPDRPAGWIPRLTLPITIFAGALVLSATIVFFGYPAWVGSHLRDAGQNVVILVFAASLCGVFGFALGVFIDAKALRDEGIAVTGSPSARAASVVLLAIVAVPVYLAQRAKAVVARDPHVNGLGSRPWAASLVGLAFVLANIAVVVGAAAASQRVFGMAFDPQTVESAIGRTVPSNSFDPLQSFGSPSNGVSCSIPGLVKVGDTFKCSYSQNAMFPGTSPFERPTTTKFGTFPGLPSEPTITWTVTVDNDSGEVTWKRDT